MARPKKPENEKKQQLNIRVHPTTRIEVAAHANRDGVPVSVKAEQLIEAMLNLSDDADPETIELLTDIVDEIKTVESLTGGKWHEDLKTYAAVSEMMKRGPIIQRKPDSSSENPEIMDAYKKWTNITAEKQRLIEIMGNFGVKVSSDAKAKRRKSGILGGMFGVGAINYREIESKEISQIDDDSERNKAQVMFDMVCEVDAREAQAEEEWIKLLRPYWQQQWDGEKIYADYRRGVAMETIRKGGLPHFEDL